MPLLEGTIQQQPGMCCGSLEEKGFCCSNSGHSPTALMISTIEAPLHSPHHGYEGWRQQTWRTVDHQGIPP
eukprot:5174296-Karenia_brevis.AAC.1